MTRTAPPRHGSTVRAGGSTDLWIYDEIGMYGVTARSFTTDLLAANGGPCSVHINSGGGDAFDGLAIYEALRTHPGHVTVYVDGLAASAASVIAMGANDVVMAPGGMIMIHDASMFSYGNEAALLADAATLGQVSNALAEIYAARAGGRAETWREVMRGERWYSASEAVAVGLADRVAEPPAMTTATARRQRAEARAVVATVRSGAISAGFREAFRTPQGGAYGVPLAMRGASTRRPAGRRPAPSAMPSLRALNAARR